MARLILFLLIAAVVNGADDFNAFERDHRTKEAKTLRERISKIDQLIPNLNPSAADFLQKERAEIRQINEESIRLQRLVRLSETKEFQQSKLKDVCVGGMRYMDYVLRDDITEDEEILGWLGFVSMFMDPSTLSYGISALERTGLFTREHRMKAGLYDTSSGHGFFLSLKASTVLDNIVIPLYGAKIMKKKEAQPASQPKAGR